MSLPTAFPSAVADALRLLERLARCPEAQWDFTHAAAAVEADLANLTAPADAPLLSTPLCETEAVLLGLPPRDAALGAQRCPHAFARLVFATVAGAGGARDAAAGLGQLVRAAGTFRELAAVYDGVLVALGCVGSPLVRPLETSSGVFTSGEVVAGRAFDKGEVVALLEGGLVPHGLLEMRYTAPYAHPCFPVVDAYVPRGVCDSLLVRARPVTKVSWWMGSCVGGRAGFQGSAVIHYAEKCVNDTLARVCRACEDDPGSFAVVRLARAISACEWVLPRARKVTRLVNARAAVDGTIVTTRPVARGQILCVGHAAPCDKVLVAMATLRWAASGVGGCDAASHTWHMAAVRRDDALHAVGVRDIAQWDRPWPRLVVLRAVRAVYGHNRLVRRWCAAIAAALRVDGRPDAPRVGHLARGRRRRAALMRAVDTGALGAFSCLMRRWGDRVARHRGRE